FWLAAAIAFTLAALRSRTILMSSLAGLFWALTILTRVELVLVIPIAWALVLFQAPERRVTWFRNLAIPSLIVALCLGAWITRNIVAMGTPTLSTQRGCTFWGAHNEVTFTSSRFAGTWVDCSSLVNATHPMLGAEVPRDRLTFDYGVDALKRHAT